MLIGCIQEWKHGLGEECGNSDGPQVKRERHLLMRHTFGACGVLFLKREMTGQNMPPYWVIFSLGKTLKQNIPSETLKNSALAGVSPLSTSYNHTPKRSNYRIRCTFNIVKSLHVIVQRPPLTGMCDNSLGWV